MIFTLFVSYQFCNVPLSSSMKRPFRGKTTQLKKVVLIFSIRFLGEFRALFLYSSKSFKGILCMVLNNMSYLCLFLHFRPGFYGKNSLSLYLPLSKWHFLVKQFCHGTAAWLLPNTNILLTMTRAS